MCDLGSLVTILRASQYYGSIIGIGFGHAAFFTLPFSMAFLSFFTLILCFLLAVGYCIAHHHTASSLYNLQLDIPYSGHNLFIDSITPYSDITMSSTISKDIPSMMPPPLPSPKSFTSDGMALRSLKRLSLKSVPKLDRDLSPTQYSPFTQQSDSTRDTFTILNDLPSRRSSISTEPNTFLTALAAQERKVLELKEELHKAESDLEHLKKQWAIHEASKKKDEMRHIEKLRPLASPISPFTPEHEKHTAQSLDQARHKAGYVKTKQPQGKVFSGSRHIRTLSLLSPTSHESDQTNCPRDMNRSKDSMNQRVKILARSATVSDVTSPTSSSPYKSILSSTQHSKGFPKDDLVNTGKQLVGDLREGIWTFIEDLRQATVGDEAVNNVRSKQVGGEAVRPLVIKKGNASKSQVPSRIFSVPMLDKSIGAQNVPIHKSPTFNEGAGSSTNTISDDAVLDDEGWGNWESPPAKASSPDSNTSTDFETPNSSVLTDGSVRTSIR